MKEGEGDGKMNIWELIGKIFGQNLNNKLTNATKFVDDVFQQFDQARSEVIKIKEEAQTEITNLTLIVERSNVTISRIDKVFK